MTTLGDRLDAWLDEHRVLKIAVRAGRHVYRRVA